MLASKLVASARRLARAVDTLRFSPPVTHVYNPLDYAWEPHEAYLRRYGNSQKRILFLGMNPGPFGMMQVGIPFGEVAAVRDWLGITGRVYPPPGQHSGRPITGFECHRSEVSGRRLWGLFAQRFGSAENFFREHFVVNYCPLAFLEQSGRNRTPDKLPASEREPLFERCDTHLREVVSLLKPEWVIGVGDFAARRATEVLANSSIQVGRILHPSPACPAANAGWDVQVSATLEKLGVWRPSTRPAFRPQRSTRAGDLRCP